MMMAPQLGRTVCVEPISCFCFAAHFVQTVFKGSWVCPTSTGINTALSHISYTEHPVHFKVSASSLHLCTAVVIFYYLLLLFLLSCENIPMCTCSYLHQTLQYPHKNDKPIVDSSSRGDEHVESRGQDNGSAKYPEKYRNAFVIRQPF